MKIYATILILYLATSSISTESVVLNEVMIKPLGEIEGERWLELYNNASVQVNLQHWQIRIAGESFSTLFTFPRLFIQPMSFFLIAEEFVPGGDFYHNLPFVLNSSGYTSGIQLLAPSGYRDTLLYGEPNINQLPDDNSQVAISYAPAPITGFSYARKGNGLDTDDCAHDWFLSSRPTPGYGNEYLIDLTLSDLDLQPGIDSVDLMVRITNPSSVAIPAGNSLIRVILDNRIDHFFELPKLLPDDTMIFSYTIPVQEAGYYTVEARLLYQNEANWSDNREFSAFILGVSPLIINEILFKQSVGNTEWIEIYNRAEKSIYADHFTFTDAANNITRFCGTIPSKSYMVITRYRDQFLTFNPGVDPEKVLEATSWAVLNNDRESLLFEDKYGIQFDFQEYTAPASYPHNLSWERINPYDDNSDWERCRAPNLSTPGTANSILLKQYDLAIVTSGFLESLDKLQHSVVIKNRGYSKIEKVKVMCYLYTKINDKGSLLFNYYFSITDSLTVDFVTPIPLEKYTTYLYKIESSLDEDHSNNSSVAHFNNQAKPVAINEIMFRTTAGEPKWIELIVNERHPFLDKVILTTERYKIEIEIGFSDYVLVTGNDSDAEWLNQKYNFHDIPIYTGLAHLYVAGEDLTLSDLSGNYFEQFRFDPNWSTVRGVSIERINPELPESENNWGYSVAKTGSTPGLANSIYTKYILQNSRLSIKPNPFSPLIGERTIISYELPERMSSITCRVFDLKGRLVNTLINQEGVGASGTIIWNGKRDNETVLPIGVYIVLLEARGLKSQRIHRIKDTVIIAR